MFGTIRPVLRGDGSQQATTRLKILQPLGSGGFGAVYEAVDTRSGQHVAVKELDDTSADSIARFKHEFRALSDCHHTNLVGLRELIEQDGRWLIVMELVPGTDFLCYVQGDGAADNDSSGGKHTLLYDEARLRGALVGVVEGLRALHAFGIVHRDLKPSNVRVRPDGRAVLLDFGLVTSVDPKQQSTHAMGMGTVVYMAPEQAGGQSLGPAVDLYALGVCLFEALTGRAPFEGNHAITILLDKQRSVAPRASSFAKGVPTDLDELCAQLLSIDPTARPSLDVVLQVLTRAPATTSLMPPHALNSDEAFAGRESELEYLERALARTHEGELRIVLVEGESGVGKSELVSEFLRRTYARQPKLIALRGRCYENEQVSYKAFDGCIDELAKILRRLPEPECAALLPVRAQLLGQLFPVLRNVKMIAKAPREGSSADPTARRLEAFAALSQLFARLAEDRPVVLVMDDLQWADTESFRLLHALVQDSVRAPILLLGTVRPRDELEPELAGQLEEVRKWPITDVVSLTGLPRAQAKQLAKKLLGAGTPEAWLDVIAEESHGHPLFLSELVQYTHSHDFAARETLTLEAALRSRVDRLERAERELLEMVALAARPYPSTVFSNALNTNVDESARSLLAAKLLRQRRGQELSCYHDRIRHAAVDLIARARLPALHYQLAAAVEGLPQGDASEQARHWDLALQPERASLAYERAATNALGALAFSRAAGLCARALALLAGTSDERAQQLTVQRADALACAGASAEAAELYQRAADATQGETRIQLRAQAASQLMLSAQLSAGYEASRQLLVELGFSVPRSAFLALLRYAWDSLCIRCEGVEGRAHQGPDARERLSLDVCTAMSRVMAAVDPLSTAVLGAQFVRRAVRLGAPAHVALAIALYAWLRALQHSLTAAQPLIARAQKLTADLNVNAGVLQGFAIGTAYAAGGDWISARNVLEPTHATAQEHCRDDPWLLTSCRYQLAGSWYNTGHHAELVRQSERWLAEARERNDVLAVAFQLGMGYAFVRHLVRDAPDAAIAELAQSAAAIPNERYGFAQFGQLLANVLCRLYQGGRGALRYLDAHRERYGRSFLLRTRMVKTVVTHLRACALLSAASVAPHDERRRLVAQAKREAIKMRRARALLYQSGGLAFLAQIEALQGNPARALELARQATRGLDAHQSAIGRSALYLEGLLEGGAGGAAKCEQVHANLRNEGYVQPLRVLGISLPLLPLLAKRASTVPASAPAALLLDRYEVIAPLGRGGFGAVVSARDKHTGRTVALKELVRSGGMPLERFKQEFRALADLHHENIVQLEALFEHEGSWYIAMELVVGTDLVSYVRASGACDAARLRTAFVGLTHALSALHQQGLVHRDVKPENVLVTPDGRAVLIDFGLIARAGDAREANPVGSVEWAAPEQLMGRAPEPAADVYALGACLYAAVSGTSPTHGVSHTQLIASRQKQQPPALNAPAELRDVARLCGLMLAVEPDARPSLEQLLAQLEARASTRESMRASLLRPGIEEGTQDPFFAGRAPELMRLERAFRSALADGLGLVMIEGESGLGKSALAGDFALRMQRANPTLHVLKSRCYENEQVAFKAFDGAVDQLAQILRALPQTQCEALLPKRAALLGQLFPVLSSVRAIASAAKKGLPAEPAARKQAGSEGFIQLLANLAAQRPLLFVIDDLQWADSESFDLLRDLAKRRLTLPILFACTVRPQAELDSKLIARLDQLKEALPSCELIRLTALDAAASAELLQQLLGRNVEEERLAELVRESKGHPLFLRELVLHEQHGAARTGALTLDAALEARINALSTEACSLLSLVAMADKPYRSDVYARALGRADMPREAALSLLAQNLIRRRAEKLSCYHDRIRHVALDRLGLEQRVLCARALAGALGSDPRDAAERARLWHEAGDPEQAAIAAEQAGDHALSTLAFSPAEQHYARALALLGDKPDDPRVQRVLVARGHALVRSGHSADAARIFQRAAQHAQGEEQVRLRIWAAQHLMQSAQGEEGMRAASELLAELGIKLPESEGSAKARIGWERLRVKLRGIKHSEHQTPAQERLVLDALHGLGSPVRAISFLPGSALVAQYLRRALAAGDPRHTARGLAFEALWRSINSPLQAQDALFDESRALAERVGEPGLLAEVDLTRGVSEIARNQLTSAVTYLGRAHELLVSQCPGQPWLLTAARMYLGSAWYFTSNYGELRRQVVPWLEEARLRGDRYAVAALTGVGAASLVHAFDDDPDAGLAELEQAMAPWPAEPFTANHVGSFFTSCALHSTRGGGQRFLDALERMRPQLERAFLLRAPTSRAVLHGWRARALLSCIDSFHSAGATELLTRARAEQRIMAGLPGKFMTCTAQFTQAWIYILERRREEASLAAQQAWELYRGTGYGSEPGAQYTWGVLQGGEAGRALCDAARAKVEAQGWRSWRRGIVAVTPGSLELLESI